MAKRVFWFAPATLLTVTQRLLQLANDVPLRERLRLPGAAIRPRKFCRLEQMVDNLYHLYLKLVAAVGVQASACAPREAG